METKYKLILFLLVITVSFSILIGLIVSKSKTNHYNPNYTQYTESPNIKAEEINGFLIKKGWSKSFESYCAQGSDYYTLKKNDEELILDISQTNYSNDEIDDFIGKQVQIEGELKQKKITCIEGQQCPKTTDGNFTCDIFKVDKISNYIPVGCADCGESGWEKWKRDAMNKYVLKMNLNNV